MQIQVGQFAELTRDVPRVLVVDLGFLGDAVHLLPALWELRRHYAKAEIHLLASTAACEVVHLSRCIDHTWPVEMRREKRTLAGQWRVLREIRRLRFDVAINLNAADRSIIFMGLSGARQRLALLGGRWHAWNRWLIPHWLPRPDPRAPVYQQSREALTGGGFALGELTFGLVIPQEDQAWAESLVPTGTVHMSLCSANPLKEWPLEHHIRLVDLLREACPDLVVAVSVSARPREQERLAAFLSRLGKHVVLCLSTPMTVAQLAAVLSRCRLHIGPDSGVIHLAMALGVPTVSFFRRRGEGWRGWVPSGAQHRAFLQDCTCRRDRDAACAVAGVPRCLEALRPDAVAGACGELLATERPSA